MIKINKNESPFHAFTKEDLSQIITETPFHEYGTDEYDTLVKAYAQFNGFPEAQVSLANGSDEWIQKCMMTLGKGPVLTLSPDFSMYSEYASQLERDLIQVPCEADYSFDRQKVIDAIREVKPSFFIFSQPNNPLGYLHSDDFVQNIADALQEIGSYLVIDEAYIEFSDQSFTRPEGDHVIVLRTLSKIYGLAGLRVGVAVASNKTIRLLNSVAHPYPLNTLSIKIATALLEDQERLESFFAVQRHLAGKLRRIFNETVSDVVTVIPSQTNFVFTYGELASSLGAYVVEHGFFPRTYENQQQLDGIVRYSITSDENLDKLESVLKEWRDSL